MVEVGAGLGSLTLALAETGAAVTAIEVDRHLLPALAEVLADRPRCGRRGRRRDGRLGDVLGRGRHGWALVANLPYNVATPIVLDLLDDVPAVTAPAGDGPAGGGRAAGGPAGSTTYGIPSVQVALRAHAGSSGGCRPRSSCPSPASSRRWSTSSGATAPATDADPERLFELVRRPSASGARCCAAPSTAGSPRTQFAAAGIATDARPEELDIEDWGRLAEAVAA